MEVDPEITKEAKEKETPSSEHGQKISREEDDVTIAQITQTLSTLAPYTPMPNPSSSVGEQKRSKVKKEKLLQVNKSYFASKPRNALSGHDGKCTTSSKKEKIGLHTLLGEAKSSAMIRAKEVQSNLEAEFPSFVKLMVRSQVTKGFWMGLPIAFCKSHLPRKDIMVRLEDEHGGTYEARFLADKTGLSAGWRQFSIGHKLLEGDVLVFQLVELSKFKVFIIRENELTEVDEGQEALTLLNLDAHSKQNDQDDAEMGAVVCNNMKRKRSPKSLPLATVQEKIKRTGMHRQPRTVRKLGKTTKQSENDSENVSSAVQPVEFNEEVQKGGEEKATLSSEAGQAISQEDDITLAQISQTPRTFAPSTPMPNPSSSGKQKKLKVEKETLLPIKKGRLASKSRNAISEQAQKCTSCPAKKAAAHTPGQAKSSAMIRAEEIQSNLESEYPSFIKSMLRSHVSSCFWMGLPGPFCKSHLPRKETMVTLKDEDGGTYDVKFIPEKTGLSGGWKHFSVGHKLLEGDVLVFQLIEPLKLKVYITRANDLTEVDGTLNLLNLGAHTKQNDQVIGALASTNAKRKCRPKCLPLSVVQKKNKNTCLRCLPKLGHKSGNPKEYSENERENVGPEVLEGTRFPGSAVQFKDDVNYDTFHIMVKGLLVDSELSENILTKYYKLCYSQNAFLHDRLVKGLNFKLITGVISETVNISEAVRGCNLTITREEFAIWDQTLKALEVFGMSVSFLRARLNRLLTLAFESEGAMDRKKYMEAQIERAHRQDDIRNLEAKLVELKDVSQRFGADMETLKSKVESCELKFHEEVTAPW